jgi:hypothetical protein
MTGGAEILEGPRSEYTFRRVRFTGAHVGDSGADRACRPLNNEPLGS